MNWARVHLVSPEVRGSDIQVVERLFLLIATPHRIKVCHVYRYPLVKSCSHP